MNCENGALQAYMKQSFVQRDMDEFIGASPTFVAQASAVRQPSYHPTPWAIVNRVLDIVDKVTKGKAGWLQRFFSFAFIGGMAALVNLTVFFVLFYLVPMPFNPVIHNVIAYVIACEISIMANFVPNDYFTFRHLPGSQQRSWSARCVRFHMTSISGSILTFLIQFAFTYAAHIPAIIGQAAALIIVLFYNFTVHHLFTYRHAKSEVHEPLVFDIDTLKIPSVESDTLKIAVVQSSSAEPITTF